MTEEWRDVPGFDGRYQVSDQGRVRSLMHRYGLRAEPKILRGQRGRHPTDNRLANLRWDTHRANAQDARRNGRLPTGERHGSAKLDASVVQAIRARRGEPSTVIAAALGLNARTVRDVLSGKTWSHVSEPGTNTGDVGGPFADPV